MERPVSPAALLGAALIVVLFAWAAGRIASVPAPVAPLAPAAPVAAAPAGPAVVTLERGACYGPCPVYAVRVSEDGHVEFKGEHFVCATTPQTAEADAAQVRALVAAMRDADFAHWPQYDRFDMTDQTTATITLAAGDTSHRVVHYHGMTGVPQAVADLEDRIAAVAGVRRWLPVDHGRGPTCRQKDGSDKRMPLVF